jgi:hypothetical protein
MVMQIIKSALFLLFFVGIAKGLRAQYTYLPVNSSEYRLLDRLEIKKFDSTGLMLPATRPVSRAFVTPLVKNIDSAAAQRGQAELYELTAVDRYNVQKLLMNNREYSGLGMETFKSKKPLWNRFFLTRNNLYETHTNNFSVVINPVIQQTQSLEVSNNQRVFLNSKGLELRGHIGKKIGFYSYLTDNQERGPLFVQQRIDSLTSVPGAPFNKIFKKTARDYFDYRGYITFNVAKFVDVQYGFDKNFIGHGHRSLFLSDFSAPNLFMKLNTRIWKLNYQNLFMELTPSFDKSPGNTLLGKKYAAMHHLSINIGQSAQLGLFESVVFNRPNRFDFAYLVPVIFYRSVESGLGSADNALIGADFKANFFQHLQLYGQVVLDEFKRSELNRQWWGNKIGVQAGMKYIDVAGVDNLDFQFEWNVVRPYTYSHSDSVSSYTHYNQPLAHPLGANFSEITTIVRYQPMNRLAFEWKTHLNKQGTDSSVNPRVSYGGNIFLPNPKRQGDYGQGFLQGHRATWINTSVLGSYEIRPNLYADASLLFRHYKKTDLSAKNTLMLTVGVRWNIHRREYDY